MQLTRLLSDLTRQPAETSGRRIYKVASDMLNAGDATPKITPKGVEKWVSRGSIPGAWLVRIATVANDAGRPIDLSTYA